MVFSSLPSNPCNHRPNPPESLLWGDSRQEWEGKRNLNASSSLSLSYVRFLKVESHSLCVCVRIWAGYMEKQQKHQDHPHGHAPAQGLVLKALHTYFNDLLLLSWKFQYFFKQGTLNFYLPWPLQIMQLVLGNITARSSIPGMQAHDTLRVAVQRQLQGMSRRKGLRECQVLRIWHWMGSRQMLMHSIEEYRSYWTEWGWGRGGRQRGWGKHTRLRVSMKKRMKNEAAETYPADMIRIRKFQRCHLER